MNKNIKIAIANKVKKSAVKCHEIHGTKVIYIEACYVDYYIHCLKYFGCVVSCNTQNKYLDFAVGYPDRLEKSIDSCAESYPLRSVNRGGLNVDKNTLFMFVIFVVFLFGVYLGYQF